MSLAGQWTLEKRVISAVSAMLVTIIGCHHAVV